MDTMIHKYIKLLIYIFVYLSPDSYSLKIFYQENNFYLFPAISGDGSKFSHTRDTEDIAKWNSNGDFQIQDSVDSSYRSSWPPRNQRQLTLSQRVQYILHPRYLQAYLGARRHFSLIRAPAHQQCRD